MQIKQIYSGRDNFNYIIYDQTTKKAAIIDLSFSIDSIIKFLNQNQLIPHYIIATHHHHDHTQQIPQLKQQFPAAYTIASEKDSKHFRYTINIIIHENQTVCMGSITLRFLLTPGHTPGSMCILANNKALFTGDTLFIDDCGRTDLPGGSLKEMYHSLQTIIKPLPDSIIVYPGHNYGSKPYDTLGNQKKTNKTLTVHSLEAFSQIE